jgi:cytochrome c-type biogenesis protein
MPSVQRAQQDFGSKKNIRILTISIDAGGAKDVAPYLKENSYTMPVLLDSKMEVFSKFGLLGTPGTFVIDRQGKIAARGFGAVDFDHADFRKYVVGLAEA